MRPFRSKGNVTRKMISAGTKKMGSAQIRYAQKKNVWSTVRITEPT